MKREKNSAEKFASEHNDRTAAKLGLTMDKIIEMADSAAYVPDTPGKQLPLIADACRKIENLPTILAGKEALGLQSIMEVPERRVHLIESPFTDPLQIPYAFLPGVPAHPFYESGEFPWGKTLEEAYPAIKEELLALIEGGQAGFKIYKDEWGFVHPFWNTYNFFIAGEKVEENCARCPKTTAVLESLPRFEKDHIMFSALNPQSHLPPHVGPLNGILRGHLPLLAPRGCVMKVGNEVRPWEEGKVMVFDDSFVHSAWNPTDDLRVVLFLNFWHPCFSDEEVIALREWRNSLQAMSGSWKTAQGEQRLSGIVNHEEG
jgi:aspartyl/asparaginyl beta-hydroxylase (cupin superfamily)